MRICLLLCKCRRPEIHTTFNGQANFKRQFNVVLNGSDKSGWWSKQISRLRSQTCDAMPLHPIWHEKPQQTGFLGLRSSSVETAAASKQGCDIRQGPDEVQEHSFVSEGMSLLVIASKVQLSL